MITPRRYVDIGVALGALIVTSPLMLVAAIGIKLTSPGPILYRARRIARDRRRMDAATSRASGSNPEDRRSPAYLGREFVMYKFRTMHVSADAAAGAPITASADSRVFPFGSWLRATKIDELPQLFNVLRGDMALVGPRPEDPSIVREHYTPLDRSTLQVAPGLTSPGSIYYYTHGEQLLQGNAVVNLYVEALMPRKLALDRVYMKHASVLYDLRVIARTCFVIVARAAGSRRFPEPPELRELGGVPAGSRTGRTRA
jgi:lipopolysaccharide/colanic/teichoic acid biosynthesis glycosyltransferase